MPEKIPTACCISGGGPAGIMLGFLLARAGIDVTVLEKWPDFFRDFRGDTIHPSTMEILSELGLLDEFLTLPHEKAVQLEADVGTEKVIAADFSHLKLKAPFVAFIPQWDFLNFIVKHASAHPSFHLKMNAEATGLIEEDGHVVGVMAKSGEAEFEIRSKLVVGADGRHSTIREKSGLAINDSGAPMDVLWFRLPRKETDPSRTLGRVDDGKILIMIERGSYWQCGYLIKKGALEDIKKEGLASLQKDIVAIIPFMANRIEVLNDWDLLKLLTVTVDRLETWYRPGLICIGDAAHAMSPIGGVGINLAIQDAVAAANILVPRFLADDLGVADLKAIQKRRELPTRIIQGVQVFIQNKLIKHILGKPGHPDLPWQLRLLRKYPYLRRIPARMVGVGFRPEHIAPSQRKEV
jgi:2-polyprenyl-6-methoxyphenol hydroxylase-like FAD-dependent oxidoreductase